MTTTFADKMRQRFAARAAERAGELPTSGAASAATPLPTQPPAQGAVGRKVPVAGPPPRSKARPQAAEKPPAPPKAKATKEPKKLRPVATRKVLNRASEAGCFDPAIAKYRELTKEHKGRSEAAKAVRTLAAKGYFQDVRDLAASLVGQEVGPDVARVIWSKTNQRPSFRRPKSGARK